MLKNKLIFFISILFFIQCSTSEKVFFESTMKENRGKYKTELIEKINENLSRVINSDNEKKWEEALWAINFIRYKTDTVKNAFSKAFKNFQNTSLSFQRAFLECVYSIYENEFIDECWKVLNTTDNPKIFAMASLYVIRVNNSLEIKSEIIEIMKKHFSDYFDNPILFMLEKDLVVDRKEEIKFRPDLVDLLKQKFDDKPVIFSFQRVNRKYEGIVVIRKDDGKFLRDDNGELFCIPQLALSLSNLPGYITNGNTSQGIFSIQKIKTTKNIFIGPTKTLILALPYEVSVAEYFHNEELENLEWTLDAYELMLPNSWYGYHSIYEAYYAGKAGRNEILAHGTTIDPEYYKNENCYPNTPSLGCLTAKEIWGDNGYLEISEQQKLINAFESFDAQNGYLIVIDIDDQDKPVKIEELKDIIFLAELNK